MASFNTFSIDDDDLNASNSHFDQDDVVVEDYTDYASFFGGAPPEAEVSADRAGDASTDVFGFDDPSSNYSHSTPFDWIPVENGNGNVYGVGEHTIDDDVFTSDGPVLPPLSEMVHEEGWRRLCNAVFVPRHERFVGFLPGVPVEIHQKEKGVVNCRKKCGHNNQLRPKNENCIAENRNCNAVSVAVSISV